MVRDGRECTDTCDVWDDSERCDLAEYIVELDSLLLTDVADRVGEGGKTE